MSKQAYNRSFDLRTTLYKSSRTLLFAVIIAVGVKFVLFDSIMIAGNQMSPTTTGGDRLLIFRVPFLSAARGFFKPPYDKPVVYKDPHRKGSFNILRLTAFSGDTVSIDSALVKSTHPVPRVQSFAESLPDIIPADYSQRDYFDPYRIPEEGDFITFANLTLRDFFFMRAVVQQEEPKKSVTITSYLLLNDSVATGYVISDFALYHGALDSIPDSLRHDWFFWYRLEEYLYQKHDTHKVSLYFTLSLDGTVLDEYTVKNNYCFFLADNRKTGYDSRYFGPIAIDRCIGRALMVLWSHGDDPTGKWEFRFKRLGKLLP